MSKQFWYWLTLRLLAPNSRAYHEWLMLGLLNKERKKQRLRPLIMANDLRKVARRHSKDMAVHNYFDHQNQTLQSPHDRIQEARISDAHTGENLAKIRGYKHPTHIAMDGLMKSPGHRENILRSTYTTVGIGLHVAEDGTMYYTQNFARRVLRIRGVRHHGKEQSTHTLSLIAPRGVTTAVVELSSGKTKRSQQYSLQPGRNTIPLTLTNSGTWTVSIFSGSGSSLPLSNSWQIRVRKRLFGIF